MARALGHQRLDRVVGTSGDPFVDRVVRTSGDLLLDRMIRTSPDLPAVITARPLMIASA